MRPELNSGPKELFHLAAISRLRVYIAVPEAYSSAVKDGATVTMTEVDHPEANFKGTLTRNSNAFDPMSRTLTAEADVENTQGKLLPGAYVFVHFQLAGNLHSVTLPSNALLFRAEGSTRCGRSPEQGAAEAGDDWTRIMAIRLRLPRV